MRCQPNPSAPVFFGVLRAAVCRDAGAWPVKLGVDVCRHLWSPQWSLVDSWVFPNWFREFRSMRFGKSAGHRDLIDALGSAATIAGRIINAAAIRYWTVEKGRVMLGGDRSSSGAMSEARESKAEPEKG